MRPAVEGSLRRLRTGHIDPYYKHRIDFAVPVEETAGIKETVGALAERVEQGKILHIGLSEAAPATLRRTHAVRPLPGTCRIEHLEENTAVGTLGLTAGHLAALSAVAAPVGARYADPSAVNR